MARQGALACSELGEKPEQVCKQFVPQIQDCLDWHVSTWHPLEVQFQRLGFRWSAFLNSTSPETGDNAELRRIRRAVLSDLGSILESRSGWLRHKRLLAILRAWYEQVPESEQPESNATRRLRQAMRDVSPVDYQVRIRRTSAAQESGIRVGTSARTVEPPGSFQRLLGRQPLKIA